MALITKFVKVAQAQDNKSVTFDDTTGAYDVSTNPGGYGTPNPAYTDILRAVLQITNLKTDAISYYLLTQAEAQALANPATENPLTLDSYYIGQTAVDEDLVAINDGTFQIKYVPILAEAITIGATNGSVVVTGTSLTTIFANYSVIYFDGKLYEIDKVNGFTSTSMRLKTAFSGTTGSFSAQTGAMALLKFGLNGVGNTTLIKAIGQITCCSDTDQLMDILLFKFGTDAKEQCGDIEGYQKIIDGMNAYFNNGVSCSS